MRRAAGERGRQDFSWRGILSTARTLHRLPVWAGACQQRKASCAGPAAASPRRSPACSAAQAPADAAGTFAHHRQRCWGSAQQRQSSRPLLLLHAGAGAVEPLGVQISLRIFNYQVWLRGLLPAPCRTYSPHATCSVRQQQGGVGRCRHSRPCSGSAPAPAHACSRCSILRCLSPGLRFEALAQQAPGGLDLATKVPGDDCLQKMGRVRGQ